MKICLAAYGFTLQPLTSSAIRWESQYNLVTRSSSQWQQTHPEESHHSAAAGWVWKCVLVLHSALLYFPICYFYISLCQTDWKVLPNVWCSLSPCKRNWACSLETLDNHQKRGECVSTNLQSYRNSNSKKNRVKFIQRSKCARKVIKLVMRCFHPWAVKIEGHVK